MSSRTFKKMYHEPAQKWYKEITAKKQAPLPDDATGTQVQNHEAIRRHRIAARGKFANGQPLISTFFFPLDREKKVKLREMNGGQYALPELIPASQIERAYRNPTKNGPEVLKSKFHFEVAYQPPKRFEVRKHYRSARNSTGTQHGTRRMAKPKEKTSTRKSSDKQVPIIVVDSGSDDDKDADLPKGTQQFGTQQFGTQQFE